PQQASHPLVAEERDVAAGNVVEFTGSAVLVALVAGTFRTPGAEGAVDARRHAHGGRTLDDGLLLLGVVGLPAGAASGAVYGGPHTARASARVRQLRHVGADDHAGLSPVIPSAPSPMATAAVTGG